MNKKIMSLGVVTAIALILVGIFLPVPSKEIDMHSYSNNGYEEYVGGDAYNIQIEASLRGGIIAGRTAAKAILISVGALELVLTLMIYFAVDHIDSKINFMIRKTQDSISGSFKENTGESIQVNTSQSEKVQKTVSLYNEWKCSKCLTVNSNICNFCQGCGNPKEEKNDVLEEL